MMLCLAFVALLLSCAKAGDLTWYNPEVGLTACGTWHSRQEFIAALSFADFGNAPNPNTSPSCQKCARITDSSGKSAVVRIRDKCAGCKSGDIDVTEAVFKIFKPLSVGRTPVTWTYVSCSGGNPPPPPPPPSNKNYCGRDWTDSKACRQACPGGKDGECPAGQRCFASVPC